MISSINYNDGKLYMVDEDGNKHEIAPTTLSCSDIELCQAGRGYGKSFIECSSLDELCDRVKKIEEEKKEGINMELLDMYREKSLNNICKYYDELREKEYNKNEAGKAVNDLTEKFRENINKLIEKYGEDVVIYDECYFEDSIIVDIDDTEEIIKLHEDEHKCINEFENKIKEIKAHLHLLPPVNETTYDAVMPILKSYGVVNDEGKLTPYNPSDNK